METGTKISIGLHTVVLGLAAFGGPLFESDDSKAIQISEVSLITSAEFDSMMSNAPAAPEIVQPSQVQPSFEIDSAEAPAAENPPLEQTVPEVDTTAVAEDAPDVSDLAEQPQPEVPVVSPEMAEQAQEATGSAVVVPDAQVSDQDQNGEVQPDRLALLRPKPRPAPRIDTQVAPKPPTDADASKEAVESTEPDESATEQAVAKEEVAPKESTTEIVTEAEQDPNSAAPVKSARPKGRPSNLLQRAKAAEAKAAAAQKAEIDAAAEKARKQAEAKAIEEALKAATAEAAETPTKPSGPPLTGGEKGALVLAVQQCWNVPVGVANAADLVVVLSVELTPDGKLASSPKLIEPSGTPQGATQQAYEAGRRALIRCAPYNLPRDKYEQWRQLEVVFNPKKWW